MDYDLKPVIERKQTYFGESIEHTCLLLSHTDEEVVLFHKIDHPFKMQTPIGTMEITDDCYTTAFYWEALPYNVYIWRNASGEYIGCYVNIVEHTEITGTAVVFDDLIVDVLIWPDGSYHILDLDELPEPLEQFKNGVVHHLLNRSIQSLNWIDQLLNRVHTEFPHKTLAFLLKD
ncbi:DUF402 domain-containing protein [Shouchella patagoniensis]|uniref:DUF402 domain-containing protein n=1 Tax=Shouchella patagoniensis TaxID=228576 RepID=UPI0009953410|nr:DUF402 domain-containing protein [Shouchella patagoniensis]